MLGVVIWIDSGRSNALIWCEDHGELAIYEGSAASEAPERVTGLGSGRFDAGDLVRFDVEPGGRPRRAHNARCLERGYAPGLAADLRRAMTRLSDNTVVPFRTRCA